MPRASNNGGEDSPGGVITGKAGLAHAGAIVNDQSGNVLVTHGAGLWGLVVVSKGKLLGRQSEQICTPFKKSLQPFIAFWGKEKKNYGTFPSLRAFESHVRAEIAAAAAASAEVPRSSGSSQVFPRR